MLTQIEFNINTDRAFLVLELLNPHLAIILLDCVVTAAAAKTFFFIYFFGGISMALLFLML